MADDGTSPGGVVDRQPPFDVDILAGNMQDFFRFDHA